ncbi:MAG: glycoside hydrolase family 2 [Oscillospiraceae bacterium]|jgi:hypothetical protein|nr:glycoside hydrolase family 2 [Oscillospiraceae bacterium]
MALLTQWGKALDKDKPLPEYPRPQFRRSEWLNLNGIWDFAITPSGQPFAGFDRKICVPFSPEAVLSGVSQTLLRGETAWYERTFTLEPSFLKEVTLLRFGAVDSACTIYVNGETAGTHRGGYTPFTMDISALVRPGENTLRVAVQDGTDTGSDSRGKQSSKPGGIWYSPQSGIWQTVWLESLPAAYIAEVRMVPDIDAGVLRLTPSRDCTAFFGGAVYHLRASKENVIFVPNAHLWSPEDPYLYNITFRSGTDTVESYFAMRKFAVATAADGYPRLFLNNKPYFHNGALDQGYWPDGLLTPPADAAMVYDIETAKRLGFNMLRKHIKAEPLRWYYHCDRLGMLVWQDMINGGGKYRFGVIGTLPFLGIHLKDTAGNYRRFARKNAQGREQYYSELSEMIATLYNCPCIALWVPFNEGWGQFDALKAAAFLREADPSRPIDHASGWHDQGGGDCQSLHIYFRPFRMPRKRGRRAVVLSEFGGYSHAVSGHVWNPGKVFGYKIFKTLPALQAAVARLYKEEIAPAIPKGLAAAVYTQLTDVEDEVNGLLTYDREIEKLPAECFAAVREPIPPPQA